VQIECAPPKLFANTKPDSTALGSQMGSLVPSLMLPFCFSLVRRCLGSVHRSPECLSQACASTNAVCLRSVLVLEWLVSKLGPVRSRYALLWPRVQCASRMSQCHAGCHRPNSKKPERFTQQSRQQSARPTSVFFLGSFMQALQPALGRVQIV